MTAMQGLTSALFCLKIKKIYIYILLRISQFSTRSSFDSQAQLPLKPTTYFTAVESVGEKFPLNSIDVVKFLSYTRHVHQVTVL
jgi:hypothetical protein